MTSLRADTFRRPGDVTGNTYRKQLQEVEREKGLAAARAEAERKYVIEDERNDEIIDYTDGA